MNIIFSVPANFPFLPQKRCLDLSELSQYTRELLKRLNYNISDRVWRQHHRLISDFTPKKDYAIHWQMLQVALRHGIRIDTIKQIISFDQEPFAEGYVKALIKKRSETKDEFNKSLYKKSRF